MNRQRLIPPYCDICGATIPHVHPVALQFHQQQLEKLLFDEAYARAVALNRPFTDEEILKPAWDLGVELTVQMDARFVLVKEATGKQRRLWGLRPEEEKS